MTETFKKDPLETGGILLGHILDNGIWIVMEVLPPGWRSIFQYAYFEYDEQFVNYVAQNESKKYEQELSLLGLWHRHPGSMDTFSGTDDGTNRTFAGLHPQGAISGLVNIDPRFRLTMYHVSNPLQYNKVDIEVGDDLIPGEYFKLKYYDEEKGLNPYPPQKKNGSTNTGNRYEIGSGGRQTTPKNSGVMSAIIRFLDSTSVLFLLFLAGLILSLCLSFSYYKVKNTEDVKSLHKIVYCVSPSDSSIINEKRKVGENFDIAQFKSNFKNNFYQKLNVKKADCQVKCAAIFLWTITGFFLLLAIALRKRDFLCALFKKDKRFWFQKNVTLYVEEEKQIKARFSKVEKTVENGVLSFTVSTDKRLKGQGETLFFQLAYSPDYENSKKIKVYLIAPELDDLYGGRAKRDTSVVKIDGAGESYLDFCKLIPKDKISGMEVIRKLYEWLQTFETQ
jgi:hypothetical protein